LIAETLAIEGTEAAWKSVCNPLVIGVRTEGRDRSRRLELPISEVNVLKDLSITSSSSISCFRTYVPILLDPCPYPSCLCLPLRTSFSRYPSSSRREDAAASSVLSLRTFMNIHVWPTIVMLKVCFSLRTPGSLAVSSALLQLREGDFL